MAVMESGLCCQVNASPEEPPPDAANTLQRVIVCNWEVRRCKPLTQITVIPSPQSYLYASTMLYNSFVQNIHYNIIIGLLSPRAYLQKAQTWLVDSGGR